MKAAILVPALLMAGFAAFAQSSQAPDGRSGRSSLTVTAIVQSSVGLIQRDDGQQQLVVANAPDSKETFSPPGPFKKKLRPSATQYQRCCALDFLPLFTTDLTKEWAAFLRP